MDADGNLTYQVKGNTTAWQVAAITATATIQNYEDATYTLTINAIDKTVVSEKSGSEVAISGSNALTYGQSLSDSTLSGGETNTAGSFAWTKENLKPSVSDSNSTEYDVTFTPSDGVNYSTTTCQIKVTVNKAEKAPNMPGAAMNVSNLIKTVGDVNLSDYAGWEWQDSDRDTKFTVGTAVTATAVYTGTVKDNYEKISVEVAITRNICKHEHTELRNESAAACWKEGYTGDTYCKDCGELSS